MERDSKWFLDNHNNFFKIKGNDNLHFGMYVYGLVMSSNHNRGNIYMNDSNPVTKYINKDWTYELHRKINWGASDTDNIDDDFDNYSISFDQATENIDSNEYLIKRAVEFNRPDWSVFYLIGEIQGRLNYNSKPRTQWEIFTKDDFVRCCGYLTHDFLTKYKDDLVYLFNYFDERGFKLDITFDGMKAWTFLIEGNT